MLIANPIHDLAAIEVGQHLYWNIGPFTVHGQVLLTTWFVTALLLTLSLVANSQLKSLPTGLQNLTEYTLEFIRDLSLIFRRLFLLIEFVRISFAGVFFSTSLLFRSCCSSSRKYSPHFLGVRDK